LNGNGGSGGVEQGTANPISNPSRNSDLLGTTSGSPVVTDSSITANDQGSVGRRGRYPEASYVGTVTARRELPAVLGSEPAARRQRDRDGVERLLGDRELRLRDGDHGPNPDFARSSRLPNTPTGGSAPCGDELRADTFWGFGQDGVAVIGFNNHATC